MEAALSLGPSAARSHPSKAFGFLEKGLRLFVYGLRPLWHVGTGSLLPLPAKFVAGGIDPLPIKPLPVGTQFHEIALLLAAVK
jgi:hypothetical protein